VDDFAALQGKLLAAWRANVAGSHEDHVVVVLPSFSMSATMLSHYLDRIPPLEHRFLVAALMLRTIPGADMVMVTCADPGEDAIDYYARLAYREDPDRLKERLHIVVVPDASARGVAAKLLDRPDLVAQVRSHTDGRAALVEAWNVTDHEVRLALALDVPVNGTPPHLWPLGFKSAGRRLFHEAGVPTPIGAEDVHGPRELAAAVEMIRRTRPDLSAVVVKHDDSGAGDGNLVLPTVAGDGGQIAASDLGAEFLRRAPDWFVRDLTQGGIIEELIRGEAVTSPSAQIDIGADGSVQVLSTHEQVLGGENGQVFLGCRFPADAAYAGTLARHARSIGTVLARNGVLGRVAVDFVAVRRRGAWDVVALELNLRRGGTTHPYTVLRHMVPGSYDEATGQWIIDDGTTRCYRADDNLLHPDLLGMLPATAIRAIEDAGLGFDPSTHTGVVLHMLSGLAVDGRIGLTAIGRDRNEADAIHSGVEPTLVGAAAAISRGRPSHPPAPRRTAAAPNS
jgi:GNAT superfamily N-acetyltransferase